MPNHLLEETDIHYAFSAVHRFFDVYGLGHALQYTESSLLAATANKVWKGRAPGDLLFFTDNLAALCQAVFTIHSSYAQQPRVKIKKPADGVPDISATQHFMDSYHHSNAWNNFPRSLTAAQYHNPYKAIAKFCNYMPAAGWLKFIKELLEYALSNDSVDDGCRGYNILKIRRSLLQMVEAAHLIDVRLIRKL